MFDKEVFNTLLIIASTVIAIMMATIMIFVRMKIAQQPTSVKKIIIPPLMMSTGSLMFIFPPFQITWLQAIEALLVGMIFSIFLIKTSKFKIHQNKIYFKPSKAFIFILFGLLLIRVIIKIMIGRSISFGETSGMFFLLAFGMIATWRVVILYKFIQLKKQLTKPPEKDAH